MIKLTFSEGISNKEIDRRKVW